MRHIALNLCVEGLSMTDDLSAQLEACYARIDALEQAIMDQAKIITSMSSVIRRLRELVVAIDSAESPSQAQD